eukprot:scaffold134376_cov20-Tisochrysis_lutea.AAC.1
MEWKTGSAPPGKRHWRVEEESQRTNKYSLDRVWAQREIEPRCAQLRVTGYSKNKASSQYG